MNMKQMAMLLTFTICSSGAGAAHADNPERRGIGIDPDFLAERNLAESGGAQIDPLRSLMVTNQVSMQHFSLTEVMNQIGQTGAGGRDGTELFQRWWDTNNKAADAAFPDNIAHCDFGLVPDNGFSFACPRPEGMEAFVSDDTGSPDNYIAIAAINRIDLADKAGESCGEQRLIFARKSGQQKLTDRNLLIFEADMPNPSPADGLLGCKPIAEFWWSLSAGDVTPDERGRRLHDFFMNGLEPSQNSMGVRVSAPVHSTNYGANSVGAGQVRSNQFMADHESPRQFIWTLREFKTREIGRMQWIVPVTVKATPATELFSVQAGDEKEVQAKQLANSIILQLDELQRSPDFISFSTGPDALNMGESDQTNAELGNPMSAVDSGAFATSIIGQRLAAASLSNGISAENIMARITTQTCAGCHQYSTDQALGGNETWPTKQNPQMDFVHVSERETVDSPNGDGPRFRISEALETDFLPRRVTVMENLLLLSN